MLRIFLAAWALTLGVATAQAQSATSANASASASASAARGLEGGSAFDVRKLAGQWVESHDPDPVCVPGRTRVRLLFSPDRKRLTVQTDKVQKTVLGETDRFAATVLSSTAHSVTIRYDNEPRRTQDGRPVEWQLSVVAPGVYRWRGTDWPPGDINAVVGVRCERR